MPNKPPGYTFGRPTKLTPELQTNICQYIADGNYISTACQAVGITPQCLFDWQERAEKEAENGGGIYFDLIQAMKVAEAKQEAKIAERLVGAAMPGERKRVVRTDADGNKTIEITETGGEWLAAATYLERRHPDRWGRRERHDINIEQKSLNITRVEVVMPDSPLLGEKHKEILELSEGKE